MSQILTIGELSKRVGINPKTIRFYEDIGLIVPVRAENGYRIFNSKDEQRLLFYKERQINWIKFERNK